MPRARTLSLWWLILPGLLGIAFLQGRPRAARPIHRAEWLEAGDAKVRTVRAGAGDTTLFLIHGFGESLFTWRAVFDQFARHYRVVALDLPGFAGSDKPDASYTVEAQTARLADFIDRWTDGPIVVVGHSMGGQLAATLSLQRPERIVATVLIAPSGWSVGLGGIADTMNPSKAQAIGWYLASRAFLLPEHDPDWLGEPPSAADYSLMTDPAYRRSAARVLQDFDFTGFRTEFRRLTQPVQLIWGELDPVIPFTNADSLRHHIRCVRLTSFPTALHRPQVEIPDTVASVIVEFARAPACITSIPQ
ncbi:MAG: alpha/beta fold hydrolase [Gemmatimonadales bacterium]